MKRNMLLGTLLIATLALGSCATSQLATNNAGKDDDVYYSNAKAGDAPVYVSNPQTQQNRYNNYNDDDYYYYNSYSSRINRFGYYSPFSYYNDIYSGYSPYYSPYYGAYSGIGFGIGIGFGGYYGYSPFYNPYAYYGYNPYYGSYYPYNYGYGYGGGGYGYVGNGYATVGGGTNNGNPRPYRGSGAPANGMVNRSTENIGYNGNYPVNSAYPGRPVAVGSTANGGRQATNSYGNNSNQNVGNSRPTRDDAPRQVYTPQVQSAPPSNSGSSGGGGGSSSSSGGGGGGRPVRP